MAGIGAHRGGRPHDRVGARRPLSTPAAATTREARERHDEQPDPQARRVGDDADDRRCTPRSRPASATPRTVSPVPGRRPGQAIGAVHGGRDHRRDAEPAAAKPAMVRRHARNRQRQSHARCGDQSADPGHGTFAEAVHQPVADEPADELKSEQRDVAERRDGAARAAKAVAADTAWPRSFRRPRPRRRRSR